MISGSCAPFVATVTVTVVPPVLQVAQAGVETRERPPAAAIANSTLIDLPVPKRCILTPSLPPLRPEANCGPFSLEGGQNRNLGPPCQGCGPKIAAAAA